ncbi:hypothetical protein RB595_003479 [Gaeumannomyces hyphopodioides]
MSGSDDGDSGFHVDARSDIYTGSIRDSLLENHVENGRTYHKLSEGKYMMPNDESEQDRMELLHHLYKVTFDDRLCQCPKNDGARHVLDIGTGVGAWALEYADRHPEAQVDGVDLSPIQPTFVSANCRFLIDDIENDWVFSDSFDFIFARAMLATWGIESWERIAASAFENLEPGGYFEIQDTKLPVRCDDGTLPKESHLVRWSELMQQASVLAGRPCDLTPKLAGVLERAGFVSITVTRRYWPHAPWPKDKRLRYLGLWAQHVCMADLESICLRLFTRFLGWTADEVREFCAAVNKDFDNLNFHAYWDVYSIYGQKPL